MAESGIPVDPECQRVYQDLKLRKKYKHIIYAIVDQKISVLSTSTNPDYAELLKELPADECRWAVYDANFELADGGKRQKICFISWVPEYPRDSRDKMKYATSKMAFRKALDNTEGLELQATDMDEVDQSALEYKLQGKLV